MRKTALLFALTVAALSLPPSTQAEGARTVCRDRAAIIALLSKRYNETQRSFGLQSDNRVLEFYASPSGSWTALLTLPSGRSCIVAAGEAWTVLPPAPAGEPA